MSFKSAKGLELIDDGYWQYFAGSVVSNVPNTVWTPILNVSGIYMLTGSIQLNRFGGAQTLNNCKLTVTVNNLDAQECFSYNGVSGVVTQSVNCSIILRINVGDVVRLIVEAVSSDTLPYTITNSQTEGGVGFGKLYKIGEL